jgi:hypothetical protein
LKTNLRTRNFLLVLILVLKTKKTRRSLDVNCMTLLAFILMIRAKSLRKAKILSSKNSEESKR